MSVNAFECVNVQQCGCECACARAALAAEGESRLCSLGRARRQTSQRTPSPGGNLTLRAGVGRETEPPLSEAGETPGFYSPGCAPRLAAFGEGVGPGLGALVSGRGDRTSISSWRSPELPWSRRPRARGSRGTLLGPSALSRLPGSPQPLRPRTFQAPLPPGGGSPFSPPPPAPPEKGAPSGAAGGAARPGHIDQKRKRGFFGNPLLPPARATASRPRRLQVEKSPVGRHGRESFQGHHPLPLEALAAGGCAAAALCALEPRGSAAAREPAHPRPRRGRTRARCGLSLRPRRSGLTEPRVSWAGRCAEVLHGQTRSAAMAKGPRPQTPDLRKRALLGFLSSFPVAAVRSGGSRGAGVT